MFISPAEETWPTYCPLGCSSEAGSGAREGRRSLPWFQMAQQPHFHFLFLPFLPSPTLAHLPTGGCGVRTGEGLGIAGRNPVLPLAAQPASPSSSRGSICRPLGRPSWEGGAREGHASIMAALGRDLELG